MDAGCSGESRHVLRGQALRAEDRVVEEGQVERVLLREPHEHDAVRPPGWPKAVESAISEAAPLSIRGRGCTPSVGGLALGVQSCPEPPGAP